MYPQAQLRQAMLTLFVFFSSPQQNASLLLLSQHSAVKILEKLIWPLLFNQLRKVMSQQQQSPFLRMPAEIRLNVYSYLLNDGGNQWLPIRNRPDARYKQWEVEVGIQGPVLPRQSTKYHVIERTSMFSRRCFETTYHLACEDAEFHVSSFRIQS